MIRAALFFAAAWLSASSALAVQPQIDRTISREPVYKTKAPKYGLLVLGPEAKDRVWMVLDGDTLYVDRNGNGDLTEPGEKIAAEMRADRDPKEFGMSFDVGELNVGGHVHKGLAVSFIPLQLFTGRSLSERAQVKAALAKDPGAALVMLNIDVQMPEIKGGGIGGRAEFMAGIDVNGVLLFADTPASAPVVHLGGPLQITFYNELPAFRAGRETDVVLMVGTPGIGPGTFAGLRYDGTISTQARPEVHLSLPSAKAGEPPVKTKYEIKERC
jgi:hypothetical protein